MSHRCATREVNGRSEHWFFPDPIRPSYANPSYFFSPPDGVLLYQKTVDPDEPIVDRKGSPYSLRDAMRNRRYDRRSVVVGIFMTFFDVHVNRVPYSGRLSYRVLERVRRWVAAVAAPYGFDGNQRFRAMPADGRAQHERGR